MVYTLHAKYRTKHDGRVSDIPRDTMDVYQTSPVRDLQDIKQLPRLPAMLLIVDVND